MLNGPYCPIYGFGSLFTLFLLGSYKYNIILFFILTVFVASLIEYVTHWILEKYFDLKIWDYKNNKFNINGRVCLKNSLIFGVLGIVLVYLVNPAMVTLLSFLSDTIKRFLSTLIILVFLIDIFATLNSLINLRKRILDIKNTINELLLYAKGYSILTIEDLLFDIQKLKKIALLNKDEAIISIINKFEELTSASKNKFRLLRAYPALSYKVNSLYFNILKDNLYKKITDTIEVASTKVNQTKSKVTKKIEKVTKKNNDQEISFACGKNFYKLFWLFFVSSIIGYVVESMFYFVFEGSYASRQGLLYGPFNQVYGLGAILLVLILDDFKTERDIYIFSLSAIISGFFQYLVSLLQEYLFDSRSWDYSQDKYNLNGRTTLLCILLFGYFSVFLIKGIYPRLSSFLENLPNKLGYLFTWVLILLVSYNIIISTMAVKRWDERRLDIKSKNQIDTYLDNKYNDEYMKKIYPNMVFKKHKNLN